jgi:hypothetical protein
MRLGRPRTRGDAGVEAYAGPCMISGEIYDQSCAVSADCTAVASGDYCVNDCPCSPSAINVGACCLLQGRGQQPRRIGSVWSLNLRVRIGVVRRLLPRRKVPSEERMLSAKRYSANVRRCGRDMCGVLHVGALRSTGTVQLLRIF